MDIQKIPPIHQKRIITFVNHFIINTVEFLNKFSNTCETAMIKFEQRMRRLETSITMLEKKLDSIPGLHEVANEVHEQVMQITQFPNEESDITCKTIAEQETTHTVPEQEHEQESFIPELKKYYKMIQVGVPIDAVKLKMKQEGCDPNLLK